MKLKNSQILLIVMSLLLLISVGSVCASDNTSTDVNIAQAHEGFDLISEDGIDDSTPSDGDNSEEIQENKTINTTIEANNTKIKENEIINISIAVKDNESEEITINSSDISVFEGNNSINFTYAESAITILDKLSIGNHTLTINYLGNSEYNNSTTDIILSIFGNQNLEVPSTVASDGTNVEILIALTDGVDDYEIDKNNLKLNLTYTDEEGNITSKIIDTFNLENGKLSFTLDVALPANLNINYTDENKTFIKDVNIKVKTIINAEDVTITENETKNITVTVTSGEDTLNITKDNLEILEGEKSLEFTYENSTITITSEINRGIHNLTIKYKGNETYNQTTKNILLNIYGDYLIETNVTSIDVNSTKIGQIIINVTNGVNSTNFTADDLEMGVTFTNSTNETSLERITIISVEDGLITFEIENNTFEKGELYIWYKNQTTKNNITLNNIINVIIEPIKTTSQYQSGNFTFKVTDIDKNELVFNKTIDIGFRVTDGSLTIISTKSITTDENGIATLPWTQLRYIMLSKTYLPVGEYNVTLNGAGQLRCNNTTTLKVEKVAVIIKTNPYKEYYQSGKQFTITVISKETGELIRSADLTLYMPQTTAKYYSVRTNENGTCNVNVSSLISGDYSITITTNDSSINQSSNKSSFTILKIPSKISTKSVTISYNTGNTNTIKLTNKKTGKAISGAYVLVKLYTSSKKYNNYLFQTNNKGTIKFNVPLNVGKHKMVVSIADNRYDASSVTKYITVKKANAKLSVPKVNSYYKQGKYLVAKLINKKNKKPIYSAKLNLKVYISNSRYYNFNGNTGNNGKLQLNVDLKPGTYKVVVSGASKNFNVKKVTSKIVVKKSPTKFTVKSAKKYFTVKVINKKTKKVISGVKIKVKVYTGKHYKTFKVKSNSKGIAKISTKSLKGGSHKVVVTSLNKYCVAKTTSKKIKVIN